MINCAKASMALVISVFVLFLQKIYSGGSFVFYSPE
jgi:hypothetical protein